jgi:hypothetical protein
VIHRKKFCYVRILARENAMLAWQGTQLNVMLRVHKEPSQEV